MKLRSLDYPNILNGRLGYNVKEVRSAKPWIKFLVIADFTEKIFVKQNKTGEKRGSFVISFLFWWHQQRFVTFTWNEIAHYFQLLDQSFFETKPCNLINVLGFRTNFSTILGHFRPIYLIFCYHFLLPSRVTR